MTKPAHILRPADRRPKPAKAAAPAVYAPGWFTELIRRHRWPPRFEPQCSLVSDADIRQRATDARMRIVAEGREHVGDFGAAGRLRGDAAAAKVRVG